MVVVEADGGGQGAAKEIAAQVAATYHLPGGDQLVDVIAKEPSVSPPTSSTIPIHYVAIRGAKGQQDTVVPVSPSDSVMYSLCGLGASCSIATGKPSAARGTLVRREILELALYTFKYDSGIKNVIAFMPPRTGAPQYIILLQKSDLKPQLRFRWRRRSRRRCRCRLRSRRASSGRSTWSRTPASTRSASSRSRSRATGCWCSIRSRRSEVPAARRA